MSDAQCAVVTVLGPIASEAVGPSLMHEHLICDVTPPELAALGGPEAAITLETAFDIRYDWGIHHLGNHRLTSEDLAAAELARLGAAGGSVLVEVSTLGLAPDPAALARISGRAGVHVVAGCGAYTEPYLPEGARAWSADDFARAMIVALTDGFVDTGVRAGIIGEIGCSWPWTALERRVMAGAVAAQRATGAAITVHPGRDVQAPFEIAAFVAAEGGDLSRLVIGHIDRTLLDVEDAVRLADRGVVVEYDFFGIEQAYYPFQDIDLPNDGQRLRALRRLIEAGHLERILISQDICTRTRLSRYGGHGYGYLLKRVVPMMRARGFTGGEVDTMLIGTPRRLLSRPSRGRR